MMKTLGRIRDAWHVLVEAPAEGGILGILGPLIVGQYWTPVMCLLGALTAAGSLALSGYGLRAYAEVFAWIPRLLRWIFGLSGGPSGWSFRPDRNGAADAECPRVLGLTSPK